MTWKRRMGRVHDTETMLCGEQLQLPDGRGGLRWTPCGMPAPYRCDAQLGAGKTYTTFRCIQHAPALAAKHGLAFPPGLWRHE